MTAPSRYCRNELSRCRRVVDCAVVIDVARRAAETSASVDGFGALQEDRSAVGQGSAQGQRVAIEVHGCAAGYLQVLAARGSANWGYVEELVAAMTAVSPAPGGPYGDQLVAVVQLVVLPTHVYVVDS